jgi:TetR/AcrR family transcriptional repressor of nem operon
MGAVNMGRARQFDEDTALGAAMHLFWEKGYSATSIQDLEQATGLKRTSIYNTFGNKRRLFQKTLVLYRRQVEELLGGIMEEAPTCQEAMARWLQAVIDMHFSEETPGGCLMILSVLESSQHDQETKDMAAGLFHYERDTIQARLQRGIEQGELGQNFDCEAVAGALTAASSGIMVLAMANYSRNALEQIRRGTLGILANG